MEEKSILKVYNDGSHYFSAVAFPKAIDRLQKERVKTEIDLLFDSAYIKSLVENISDKQRAEYIKVQIQDEYSEADDIDEFIQESLERQANNLWSRKKRFRNKANINKFNYFATITYEDSKHSADSFRSKLKKCLQNLAVRRGWKYMGVFELGKENGRIHFHALMYVPEGQMIGEIIERKKYNVKTHKLDIYQQNTFFADRFGERCDFQQLNDFELKYGNSIDYILKYMEKSGERVVYARGVPTYIFLPVNKDDIACTVSRFVMKFILFDDVLDNFNEEGEFTLLNIPMRC